MKALTAGGVWSRYGLSVVATLAAWLIRLPFSSLLTDKVPFLTFFPAIAAGALFGGLGPGLVATGLAALVSTLWIIPAGGGTWPDPLEAVAVGIFTAVGSLISYLCGELRAARTLFEETLASIEDAVISVDQRGRIRLMNHVAEYLTGWTQAEALGKPFQDVFSVTGSPDDQTLQALDGRQIPVEQQQSAVRGGLRGKVYVFRDLTARRRTAEQLEQANERLRIALDAGQVGVWDWDIAQNRVTWTDQVYRIHGVAPGEFGGTVEDFAALIHEEDRASVQRSIESALAGEARYQVEFRVVPPTGEVRWVETTANVFRDPNGRPLRMVGATTDLTERKRAELELRRSEERFRAVFADAPIGMVLTDLDGRFIQANQAYCDIVSYTQEELKDKSFLSLTHGEEALDNQRLFQQLLSREIPSYVIEKRVRRKDGRMVWVRASATALVKAAGQFSEVIGLVEDITERKQTEVERDQLIGALQRSNEDFAGFAHAVSHDLRSPLRTVTAMVEILDQNHRDKLGHEGAEVMKFITSAARRMDTLISDLLAFSQVDQETKVCGTVELDECLRDALTNLEASIRETRATIQTSPLPAATGHRGPLVQLLQNLIGNSLKYRGEAPPRVEIKVEANEAGWQLKVADNGIGFEPQYAEAIFAPFKRLHGEEYPGNGIGLASCRRIVERYGGRIWADATPGRGAIFTVSLPKTNSAPWSASAKDQHASDR